MITTVADEQKQLTQKNYPQVITTPEDTTFKSKGNFQISLEPETFRMFSAALYSDPIKAIVREYSTNAKDSHVEAGNGKKPFDVQLPTTKKPIFMIRDYGTGMSQEHVETIAQTYGASTKRATNLSTGKFGLGSKSALSYVHSFALLSYYKGMLYKYLIELNEDKIPELLYDGKPMETTEPDGIKIQFSIDPKDCGRFQQAALDVYKYFEVFPNFIGEAVPQVEAPKYVMEGKEAALNFTWKVRAEISYRADASRIIMGCNAYPLANELDYSDGVDYYVEIDMFEPTPSRESLTWNDRDIKKFKGMRALVKKHIAERFAKEIVGMSYWESYRHYLSYDNSFVARVANESGKFNNGHTICHDDNYRIQLYRYELSIMSTKIEVKQSYRSNRSGNRLIGKTHGNTTAGKLGGVIINPKFIDEGKPLKIYSYDTKGVATAAAHMTDGSVVIGHYSLQDNDANIKILTDHFDAEKIPYVVDTLSHFLTTIPKTKKTTAATPAKASDYPGVFTFLNSFTSVESMDDFKYYIPFDDEKSFNLEAFFCTNNGTSSDWIRSQLCKVSYEQIATALDIKNAKGIDKQICYIRPRFVENYKKLKSFPQLCEKQLIEKYSDDWLMFVAFLKTRLYNRGYGNEDAKLTWEANSLLTYAMKQNIMWLHKYIRYPFLSRIVETVERHRFNAQEINDDSRCIPPYALNYMLSGLSSPASTAQKNLSTLTQWTFTVDRIALLYKDWIDRINAETASLLRSHPYLFKDKEDLLYNSLIFQRPNATLSTLTTDDYDDESN
jgi:hypothetical protein